MFSTSPFNEVIIGRPKYKLSIILFGILILKSDVLRYGAKVAIDSFFKARNWSVYYNVVHFENHLLLHNIPDVLKKHIKIQCKIVPMCSCVWL